MQLPHFNAGPAPADIAAGLDSGKYLAQPRGATGGNSVGCLYATAAAAPTDTDDYFQASSEQQFVFWTADLAGAATWVQAWPGYPAVEVAVARIGDR